MARRRDFDDAGTVPHQSQGPADTVPVGWLLLIYRIPSEPTRLRAAVWRRLKGLGAIYLQNSVAALPAGTAAERALRKLHHEIIEMSGTALLLTATTLLGEADIRADFQAARDDEYEEIVDKCQDFLAGIEKEFVAEHFSFAELEENEVDHQKLVRWLAKVTARDAFGTPGREAADEALAHCGEELERYAARVYAEQTDVR
ncbi:MAG: ChrB domain-containing protein [Actinobacteria bacterium]|nr:ChrB domain-containing protein [Actinomycetota bacterium]